MEFKSYGHLYECKPAGWFNLDGAITVKLKCVPKKDFDCQVDVETTYGMEKKREEGHKFIAKYVTAIEGLKVDGEPVETFDKLRDVGPSDLYLWIYTAVLSQEQLMKSEIKN